MAFIINLRVFIFNLIFGRKGKKKYFAIFIINLWFIALKNPLITKESKNKQTDDLF